MKIGIGMPVINQYKYSKKTLDTIHSNYNYVIMIVDNGSTDETQKEFEKLAKSDKRIKYYRNASNLGCSAGMNLAMKEGFYKYGCDVVININNDIYLRPDTIDNLAEDFLKYSKDCVLMAGMQVPFEWSPEQLLAAKPQSSINYQSQQVWACYAIGKEAVEDVGWFDENIWPGYWEDVDYFYRIKMVKKKAYSTNRSLFYHFQSKSLDVPEVRQAVNLQFEKNKEYFLKKHNLTLAAYEKNIKRSIIVYDKKQKEAIKEFSKKVFVENGRISLPKQNFFLKAISFVKRRLPGMYR